MFPFDLTTLGCGSDWKKWEWYGRGMVTCLLEGRLLNEVRKTNTQAKNKQPERTGKFGNHIGRKRPLKIEFNLKNIICAV